MAFIYVTIILDTLALGITIPVLPHLITNFVGDKAETAAIYGLLVTIWGLMQFLFSPLIGVLSDRFGRRPVLILSGFGLGLDYIIMALAQSLPWFFVGRILSGIMSSSFATAAAYVADVTPVERRAGAFGMVGAAWGIGFIAGPAIGGVLGTFGIRIPFWGAAAFSLASASYGLFVLPESLAKEHRPALRVRRAGRLGPRPERHRPAARRLRLRTDRICGARLAKPDDSAGRSFGTGATPGCEREHCGSHRSHRPHFLRACILAGDRLPRPVRLARPAFPRRSGPHARCCGCRGPRHARLFHG